MGHGMLRQLERGKRRLEHGMLRIITMYFHVILKLIKELTGNWSDGMSDDAWVVGVIST